MLDRERLVRHRRRLAQPRLRRVEREPRLPPILRRVAQVAVVLERRAVQLDAQRLRDRRAHRLAQHRVAELAAVALSDARRIWARSSWVSATFGSSGNWLATAEVSSTFITPIMSAAENLGPSSAASCAWLARSDGSRPSSRSASHCRRGVCGHASTRSVSRIHAPVRSWRMIFRS